MTSFHGSSESDAKLKPVAIGVIDTGVDAGCAAFEKQGVQGIGVRRVGNRYEYDVDFHDLAGHGTAMAARIQSFCVTARICAVRIAQQKGDGVAVRVQEQALAMGIEWCVERGVRVVNVSYNIAEAASDGFLARACREAHGESAILVAAYRNGEKGPVYPAAFPTVIGVRRRGGLEPGGVSVLSEKNLDLFAWGGSNSLAAAQVSAMVGRIHSIDDSLGLEAVFAYLMEVAVE
ncbi:MAG: S8 family serine peptidase [Planctomycetes bacterium]|nr:S8 family serine peptidase [Planctomycetota bacterium]